MRGGVSIILCTFNGKDRLASTLEAIKKLEPDVPKELVLVDNGSNNGTGEWVQHYFETGDLGIPCRYIFEAKPGLIYARIAGIKSAAFDLLLFCDDDNALASDYLKLGSRLFQSDVKMGVLGGYGIPVFGGAEPDWLRSYQKSFALGPQAAKSGRLGEVPSHVYGAGSFFRKEPLLGLINSGYRFYLTGRTKTQTISGDDLELCWLMQLIGFDIHYSENLKFFHTMPQSRLTTDYLIKMKSGTASGSALLFTYRYFLRNRNSGAFGYSLAYSSQFLKAGLIHFKHNWIRKDGKETWESDLARTILASRWNSFRENFSASRALFAQLQSKKEFWKLNP